ncbi:MAG: hypothetical protein CMM76_13855 [Rhodospirillaceae bacterium]|nr:hypothetical protein [Rhodospirillaceae bacterium]
MNNAKLRVLCLDIEGGYGGSSRSLYESIAHIDKSRVDIRVWCKRTGPIQSKYAAINVPVSIKNRMPKISALPRLSRNLFVFSQFAANWCFTAAFRKQLVKAAQSADIVHFNHESLFLLAQWLKPRTSAKLSMHIRTNLYGTPFCRWQNRTIANTIERLIFITENERETFNRLAPANKKKSVIYNIAVPEKADPHPKIPNDNRFKIACLSNFAWVRGVDRTAEIALGLCTYGRRDIQFIMAGDMTLPHSLPGELGETARAGGSFQDYVEQVGVSDMFLFLGHIPDPERVLASCNALIKPTREANPWGRDILEAFAAGKPVISIGTYDTFVKDRVTGVLLEKFDAVKMARRIADLADNPEVAKRLGQAGLKQVMNLCDGASRAQDLLGIWEELAN